MTAPDGHDPSAGPLRFGVLGCAEIARRKTLPAMLAVDRLRLTVVASRDLARAEEVARRFGGAPVRGYEAVLERADVDAVYVPLPTMLHAEWVERALLAGKHVLVEKPLAARPSQSYELLDLARSRELVLMECSTFLYHSQHRRVRELLSEGVIGTVRQFSAAFTIPPRPPDDNRYRPDVGGGALLDVGPYPIRAAVYFLGLRLDVAGAVLRHERRRGVVISGIALLATPDGVPATVTFGMEHSYRSEYVFAGSEGRLSLDRAFTPAASHPPVVRLERQDHREEFVLPADDQTRNALRAFVSAVLDRTDIAWTGELSRREAAVRQQLVERATCVEF